jgi:proline iminopeptidase
MRKISISLLAGALILTIGCKKEEEGVDKVKKPVVSEGFVTIEEGVELRFKTIGNGPQGVVIPAAMYLEYEFEQLIDEGRTLIFYDPRGRGKSSKVADPKRIGMNFEITDMEAIRKNFNKDKISLIGWSYLGAMVILYADKYRDHVDRVVQVGPLPPTQEIAAKATATPVDSETQAKLEEMKEQGIDKTDPVAYCRAYWETYMSRIFYDPANISRFHSEYYTFSNESPENVNFLIMGIFQSIGKWDWREQVKALEVPVLTIHGDHDSIPMEGARTWVYSLPNARLLVIPNAGHLPFVEDPELFYSSVDGFLRGDWPVRAEVVGVPVSRTSGD